MEHEIHSYYLAAASARQAERVGPFLVSLNPTSANPYLSYAVPDHGVRPSDAEVAALIEVFRHAGRQPRLEYLPAAAPEVEPVLARAGFGVEARLELMVCTPGRLRRPAPPSGIEIGLARSDEDLWAELTVVTLAYGHGGEPSTDDVAGRRAFCDRGGLVVLARDATSGEPAGSGIGEVPRAGVAELATVGVVAHYRGRGIAGAVTGHICTEAFERGVRLLWLTPLHNEGRRIYERVGFHAVSEAIHISLAEETAG